MVRSPASLALSILLVAACAAAPSPSPAPPTVSASVPSMVPSAAASVTPAASRVPVATPTSAPARSGWPYTLGDVSALTFAPDGDVYFMTRDARGEYQRIVVALDAAGRVKPGWPIEAPPDSDYGSMAVGSDGSVYIEECGGLEVGCVLHRLGDNGRDLPGWPSDLPPDFSCPAGDPYDIDDPRTPAIDDPCPAPDVDISPDGTAYLTSQRAEGPRILAVDASGRIKAGWPINLDDQDWSRPQLGADGSLFMVGRPAGTPTYDPSRGIIDDDAMLWAFGPDGKPRSGWPVATPNIGGYLIGPQGDIVVWSLINDVGELCSNPRRTVFTVLGSDGRTVPGWPRGSTGHASSPVVADDGTVYYVSATYKVYAHDRAGEVKPGWPVAAPGAGNACGPESPHLAPDGTLYVVGDEVLALSPAGRSRPGWPYRPTGQLIGPCFDSECYGGHGAPTFAPDGTLYLIVYHTNGAGTRAEVVALDRQGQPKPGWPYRLPFDANTIDIGALTVSLEGRLLVGGGSSPDVLLGLDPDGTLSD